MSLPAHSIVVNRSRRRTCSDPCTRLPARLSKQRIDVRDVVEPNTMRLEVAFFTVMTITLHIRERRLKHPLQ